jgi:hypothetical protein
MDILDKEQEIAGSNNSSPSTYATPSERDADSGTSQTTNNFEFGSSSAVPDRVFSSKVIYYLPITKFKQTLHR